jgi:methionyl-tRNA formyltransferase
MDTGPVLLERRVAIAPAETAGELLARLAPIGADALLAAIVAIAAGAAQPVAQDHARATHAPMLTKADGAIDFTQPAAAVAARIRGVDPWPGAQAVLRGEPVKLFRVQVVPAGGEAPGTVLAIDAAGARVACGDGAVSIAEIQSPGRKRLTLQQFASGRAIAVGDVLARPELR